MSIFEDVRDKDGNPFEFYQSIKKKLTSGEGSAESIRAKCNTMTEVLILVMNTTFRRPFLEIQILKWKYWIFRP